MNSDDQFICRGVVEDLVGGADVNAIVSATCVPAVLVPVDVCRRGERHFMGHGSKFRPKSDPGWSITQRGPQIIQDCQVCVFGGDRRS